MLDRIRTLDRPQYARKMHLSPVTVTELFIFNELNTIRTRVQLPPAPPIMIGLCQDSTRKNRELAVSAGHRPDGEGTRKDTQRSRGSLMTQKPAYAGFFVLISSRPNSCLDNFLIQCDCFINQSQWIASVDINP